MQASGMCLNRSLKNCQTDLLSLWCFWSLSFKYWPFKTCIMVHVYLKQNLQVPNGQIGIQFILHISNFYTLNLSHVQKPAMNATLSRTQLVVSHAGPVF